MLENKKLDDEKMESVSGGWKAYKFSEEGKWKVYDDNGKYIDKLEPDVPIEDMKDLVRKHHAKNAIINNLDVLNELLNPETGKPKLKIEGKEIKKIIR